MEIEVIRHKTDRNYDIRDSESGKWFCSRSTADDVLRELESMGDVSIRFVDEMFDKRK